MRVAKEEKAVANWLKYHERLPIREADPVAAGMVEKGWLVKEGEHYLLSPKGIAELVKPTYRMTWENLFLNGRHSWRSHQGLYGIEQHGEIFTASCRQSGRQWTDTFESLKAAKDGCREHDWSFVRRRPLEKVDTREWAAAAGRIRVKYLTAPELRMDMPSGCTTTTPGYAIYVDSAYEECAFSLRDAQHYIGNTDRYGIRVDLPEE